MADVFEPIGGDAAVKEALSVLEKAMFAAATRQGFAMRTLCLVWALEKDTDAYGASFLKGDSTPETLQFLSDILLDDSDGVEIPDPRGVLN